MEPYDFGSCVTPSDLRYHCPLCSAAFATKNECNDHIWLHNVNNDL